MAKGNVFEKPYVDERDKNNLEGLLEQFNLPPGVVAFVRKNKRMVQGGIVLLVVLVIAWSLYDTYRGKKTEQAVSALYEAQTTEGPSMLDNLQGVAITYKNTDAALWADITRANALEKDEKFDEARVLYKNLRERVGESSSLYPLLTYGIGQTSEMLKDYPQAQSAYQTLKGISGFAHVGYLGLGRVAELQNNPEAALEIYEEYLNSVIDDSGNSQKQLIEEKVASLKATR